MPGNVFLRFNNLPFWKQIVYLRQQSLGLIFENLFAGETFERSGYGTYRVAEFQGDIGVINAADCYTVYAVAVSKRGCVPV